MTINWNDFKSPMIANGIAILGEINALGYEAYVVGGTVRDIIMGKTEVNDLDISTNMPISEIKEKYRTIEYGGGEKHGTVIVHHGGFDYELTQFRSDGTYSDNRRPDSVTFVSSFEEDTKRRDFTINAMGIDFAGKVIDYHGGIDDIKSGVIRTVGNAEDRFKEDCLRILRAIRFAARFDFTLTKDTIAAIRSCGSTVTNTSPERIGDEFCKMIKDGANSFSGALYLINKHGLSWVVPEIDYSLASIDRLGKLNTNDVGAVFGVCIGNSAHVDSLQDRLRLDNSTARRIRFIAEKLPVVKSIIMGDDLFEAIELLLSPDGRELIGVYLDLNHMESDSFIKRADDLVTVAEKAVNIPNQVSEAMKEAGIRPSKEFGNMRRRIINALYICIDRGEEIDISATVELELKR